LESEEKDFNLKGKEIALRNLVVESLIAFKLPLADLFFNSSFSLLPNLVFSNTP